MEANIEYSVQRVNLHWMVGMFGDEVPIKAFVNTINAIKKINLYLVKVSSEFELKFIFIIRSRL